MLINNTGKITAMQQDSSELCQIQVNTFLCGTCILYGVHPAFG